jgi:nitroreductase
LNVKEVKMIDGKKMLEIITSRQSDRRYSDKPIDKEKLDRITEAARIAPSACNGQPWKFVVVTDPILISKIAEACSEKLVKINTFVDQAPALIIVIRERSNFTSQVGATIKAKDYSLIDIGIASENICLQARAEGLGSCMIGWFDENAVRRIISIPRSKRVELIITLGYSLSELRTKKRKPAREVISYNKY